MSKKSKSIGNIKTAAIVNAKSISISKTKGNLSSIAPAASAKAQINNITAEKVTYKGGGFHAESSTANGYSGQFTFNNNGITGFTDAAKTAMAFYYDAKTGNYGFPNVGLTLSGDASGALTSNTVAKIVGIPILSASISASDQILGYNGSQIVGTTLPTSAFRYDTTNINATWNVTHNLNSVNLLFQAYRTNGPATGAVGGNLAGTTLQSMTINNANSITLTFSAAISGYAIVFKAL